MAVKRGYVRHKPLGDSQLRLPFLRGFAKGSWYGIGVVLNIFNTLHDGIWRIRLADKELRSVYDILHR